MNCPAVSINVSIGCKLIIIKKSTGTGAYDLACKVKMSKRNELTL
jgi:hypothetical protein